MIRDNNTYAHDDYAAGEDEVPPTGNDVIDIEDEPVFQDELETQAWAMKRKISQRGASFTMDEDVLICESWIEVGTNQILGAEQKRSAYWGRFLKHYNESRILPPRNITT